MQLTQPASPAVPPRAPITEVGVRWNDGAAPADHGIEAIRMHGDPSAATTADSMFSRRMDGSVVQSTGASSNLIQIVDANATALDTMRTGPATPGVSLDPGRFRIIVGRSDEAYNIEGSIADAIGPVRDVLNAARLLNASETVPLPQLPTTTPDVAADEPPAPSSPSPVSPTGTGARDGIPGHRYCTGLGPCYQAPDPDNPPPKKSSGIL